MKQSYVCSRLQGRTITEVVLRRQHDRVRGRFIYEPTLVLDNGSELTFEVQESDIGIYGVAMHLFRPRKKARVWKPSADACAQCGQPIDDPTDVRCRRCYSYLPQNVDVEKAARIDADAAQTARNSAERPCKKGKQS